MDGRKEYMDNRFERLQNYMKEKNLAGILFLRPLKDCDDMWLMDNQEKPMIVSCFDNAMLAVAGGQKVINIATLTLVEAGSEDPYLTHGGPVPPTTPYYENWLGIYADYFCKMLEKNPRLGLVNGNYLRVETRDFILKYVPDTEFLDVTRDMHMIKAIKSEEEIEQIHQDVRALERAFTAMGTILRPGIPEREAVAGIRKRIIEQGSNGWENSSQCIDVKLTSARDGENEAALPMEYPGRILRLGDRVNVEVNASMGNGWHVTLGRTYFMGKAREESGKYYSLAAAAQKEAAALLKPGVCIKEVIDQVNETVFAANGVPADTHNWIYGIGNSWSGYPMAVPGWWDVPLEKGMVLAVGPRVKLEGKDPYCCMDVYEITESGSRRLGRSSQEYKEYYNLDY